VGPLGRLLRAFSPCSLNRWSTQVTASARSGRKCIVVFGVWDVLVQSCPHNTAHAGEVVIAALPLSVVVKGFGRRPPNTRRRPSSGRHPKPFTLADIARALTRPVHDLAGGAARGTLETAGQDATRWSRSKSNS